MSKNSKVKKEKTEDKVEEVSPNSLYTLLTRDLTLYSSEYKIYNKKIKKQKGIFSKEKKSVRVSEIKNVNYNQDFIQGIFGIGNVVIEDSSGKTVLRSINNPKEIKDLVRERIEMYGSEKEDVKEESFFNIDHKDKQKLTENLNKLNNNFGGIAKKIQNKKED